MTDFLFRPANLSLGIARRLFPLMVPISVVCRASIGFQPVSTEELKMTREPQAPEANAIILYRQVDRDDNGSISKEENYVRIKVLKEDGRKYANIQIAYDTDSATISNLQARSIKPDGTVVDFKGESFTSVIAKAKGYKYMAKTLVLPDVQVGSVIEYFYTVEFHESTLFDSHWVISQDLFTRRAKFSLKPYSGSTYFALHYVGHNLSPDQTPTTASNSLVALQVEDVPPFETEDYMPPIAEEQARVDFIYEDPTLPREKDQYWKEVGKRWNSQLESFTGRSKTMEQAVSQIIASGDTPEAKLQKIYARVQSMKSNTEERRGKEKSVRNVEDVWKNGHGTEYQLNWLFLALARAAGFESHGCWVADRKDHFFSPNTLQKAKLDSNVVSVKVNGTDKYYAPGFAFTPYGMLPWNETGATGLILDKEGGHWIQTPSPDSTQSSVAHTAALKLSETGDMEGKLTVTYTGLEASQRRVEEQRKDAIARKKYLEDELRAELPFATELELTSAPDWTNSDAPMVAEFTLKIVGWVLTSGERAILPIGLFVAGEKHVFDDIDRVHPIYRSFPSQKLDDLTIELPTGWTVVSLPRPRNYIHSTFAFQNQAQEEDGKLHITRSLAFNFTLMDIEKYPSIREFYRLVRVGDEQQILLHHD